MCGVTRGNGNETLRLFPYRHLWKQWLQLERDLWGVRSNKLDSKHIVYLFYSPGSTVIPTCITNVILCEMDRITYPFPKVDSGDGRILELMNDFISHSTEHVITYPWIHQSKSVLWKGAPIGDHTLWKPTWLFGIDFVQFQYEVNHYYPIEEDIMDGVIFRISATLKHAYVDMKIAFYLRL